jgi:hypothetical protein
MMKRTVVVLTGLALVALAVLAGCVEQNNTGGNGGESGGNPTGQTAQDGSGGGGESENSGDNERAALVNAAMAGAPEMARGYENMPWGSTPEEVMAAYGFRPDPVTYNEDIPEAYREKNVITSLSPAKAQRTWGFRDKKLLAVDERYNIEDVDADSLKAALTAKYGPSSVDEKYPFRTNWKICEPFLSVDMAIFSSSGNIFVTYFSPAMWDLVKAVPVPPPPPPSHELDNTSWRYASGISGGIGNIYTSTTGTLDFGNGKYLLNSETDSNNMFVGGSSSETGTYYISGDTVTLRSSEGRETQGTIIGNTLTINSTTYRRIQ